ncbi:hypothetical protein CRUP_022101 [Coryphaenoides rupestris]|nr:hypothetical protein CRUP_022101 [Coryphaenoides rupestris]
MGCAHSKNKSRSKKSKEEKKNQDEGSGKVSSEDVDMCVQKQLEHIEWSVTEKIRTETTADLSSAYEQRIKRQAEEHDRAGQVAELTADLQVYNQLKRRVQESTFKKDLLRNIEAEKNQALEEQIMLTLQQNEDRCVRMGNYQSLIQYVPAPDTPPARI